MRELDVRVSRRDDLLVQGFLVNFVRLSSMLLDRKVEKAWGVVTFDVNLVEWVILFDCLFAVFVALILLILLLSSPLVTVNDVSLGASILYFL